MCAESGVVNDQPNLEHAGIWFSDGYGDYIRHFLYAMGAQPEWAPASETHLLRSTSIVSAISYSADSVTYKTFDNAATDTLRLNFAPVSVKSGGKELTKGDKLIGSGWVFDPELKVLRVKHDKSASVEVSGKK